MRVLITGGAGFIGSHLAEAYLNKGDEVYIIDDLSTGSINNIEHFTENDRFKDKIFVNIESIFNHKKMVELVGICDVVFHLAAAVGVKHILSNPLKSMKTNIHGTEKVLELCFRFKKKILITSSSEVYGKHIHSPLTETDNIIYGPTSKFRWSYAASKLIDEFTALAYNRTKGLKVIITRLFNTVGPRQTAAYGMVIPRLVTQALNNESLTVYGNGKQTRTFTYVSDVVTALMSFMDNDRAIGEIINIGGTQEITIFDLAKKIIDKTQSKSAIQLVPYDEAFEKDFEDMQRRVPNIERARQLIGFEPEINLDTMLTNIVKSFRAEILN